MIPVYIICFNNGYYVKNTVDQLCSKMIQIQNIHILDNNSNGKETKEILQSLENKGCIIHRFTENKGHLVWGIDEIWSQLPEYFVVTDPDLQFNPDLPNNFLEILREICDLHQADRVGFALSLEDKDEFYTDKYSNNINIVEWEKQFWEKPYRKYRGLELYNGLIDTTFFLGCKSRFPIRKHIRVGSFYS